MKLKLYGTEYLFPDWSELTLFGKFLMALDISVGFVFETFDWLGRNLIRHLPDPARIFKIYKEENRL